MLKNLFIRKYRQGDMVSIYYLPVENGKDENGPYILGVLVPFYYIVRLWKRKK